MSDADRTDAGPADEPDEPPEFDVRCLVDDREEPTTVTLYPADAAGRTTVWISADIDHTVPLEDAR